MKFKIFALSLVLLSSLGICGQQVITERIEYDVRIKDAVLHDKYWIDNTSLSMTDWLEKLFESVQKGETKAYEMESAPLTPKYTELTLEWNKNNILAEYEYVITVTNPWGDPDDPFDVIDSAILIPYEIKPTDITKIRFTEKWITDEKGGFEKVVEAFAPVFYDTFTKMEVPIFWVKEQKMKSSHVMNVKYPMKIKTYQVNDDSWYKSNIVTPNRLVWLNTLFADVTARNLQVYSSMDWQNPVPVYTELVLEKITIDYERIFKIPNPLGDFDDPFDVIDTLVINKLELKPIDIEHFYFIEEWKTDEKGRFVKVVTAYAPTCRYSNSEPLFWIKVRD